MLSWEPYSHEKVNKVSIIRYCHNHTRQTNPRHQEEEALNTNTYMTARRQSKATRRDDCGSFGASTKYTGAGPGFLKRGF